MAIARKVAPSVEQKPLSKNMRASLASLHLEGITLPAADIHDLQEYDAGHISEEECLKRIFSRDKSSAK